VQVEDVPRIRLAAGRPAHEQGYLPVRPGVLCQVVVDDERVLPTIAEVLAHRAACERRDVLERGRIGRPGDDDDGVIEGAMLFERRDDLRDRGLLLSDRDVDAGQILALLIDDRVDRDRGLAGLPVADDELALAAPDRGHRVDRLDPGLYRRVDVLPGDDPRRDDVDAPRLLRRDRALAVDRPPQGIDDAADERLADRHRRDPSGRTDLVALFDLLILAQDDRADRVLLEVEGEAEHVVSEVEQLARHAAGETVDARDAVAHLDDRTDVGRFRLAFEPADLRLDDVGDL